MLFDAVRHEPLVDTRWDATIARTTISSIAEDARAAFSDETFWPIHPVDVSPERASTLTPIYYGAAGVVLSLNRLSQAGAIPPGDQFANALPALLDAHRASSLQLAGEPVLGFPIGDAGILLLLHELTPSNDVADELHRVIEANADHPARGFVWGGSGSALAALFMFERTGEDRWLELFLAVVKNLWSAWEYDPNVGCHLWMTDLYGRKEKRIMALHGFPGIVFPMLRGAEYLPNWQTDPLIERVVSAVKRTAVREDGLANWPLAVGDVSVHEADVLRVQHCIGAPGIVNSFATHLASDEMDDLLLEAGELIWRAGPLTKMPCLCHGVPGSGFAFLKLFERTGNRLWLDRARRFAMHAIEQNRKFTDQFGVRKFSLWTGDLGLAIYLWGCVEGTASFPTLDEF